MAPMTEELNFKFYVLLIGLNFKKLVFDLLHENFKNLEQPEYVNLLFNCIFY